MRQGAALAPGVLCVVAKSPESAPVKTRLQKTLGAPTSVALWQAFVHDTLLGCRNIPGTRLLLATTAGSFQALAESLGVATVLQGEGDLGARLQQVVTAELRDAPFVILVGGDTPGLPASLLQRAVATMSEGTHDAVLAPSADGGFVLLGLRACPPTLFEAVRWGTAQADADMRARLHALGLRHDVLQPWFDVDELADLERLEKLLQAGEVWAPRTAEVLRRWRSQR